MTLDDAAAALDCTENHVKDLIRDKKLRGTRTRIAGKWRYNVLGKDVRARRRKLDARFLRKWAS